MSYIVFEKQPRPAWRKTDWYIVRSVKGEVPLGRVSFFPQWRKFVFDGIVGCVLDSNCLMEVVEFLNQKDREWREGGLS